MGWPAAVTRWPVLFHHFIILEVENGLLKTQLFPFATEMLGSEPPTGNNYVRKS